MQMLELDASALAALEAINLAASAKGRALAPVALADGRRVLNADLLDDCGAGQTWSAYADVLEGLPVIQVTAKDFPVMAGEA